jgi:hypothetical protein
MDRSTTKTSIRLELPPYVASRVLVAIAAVFVLAILPGRSVGATTVLTTWDGQWYLSIAEHGYLPDDPGVRPNGPPGSDPSVDGAVAFFPAYPAIVAGAAGLTPIPIDDVALVLAVVFGGVAAVAFARLARTLRDDDAADRAVLLFCFFPGAFILSFAYPEGLLIAAACLCLIQLQRRAWVSAGLFAALAGATRPNGIALVVPCVVAAFADIRETRRFRPLIAPLLAPVGFVAYVGYIGWRSGELGYWWRANRTFWHDRIGSWPELHALFGGSTPDADPSTRAFLFIALVVGSLVLIAMVVLMFQTRLPAPVISYALAYEGLSLLTGALAARPRFILAAFPLVMATGFALKGRVFTIALAISSAGMVLMLLFYAVPYLQGRFLVAP